MEYSRRVQVAHVPDGFLELRRLAIFDQLSAGVDLPIVGRTKHGRERGDVEAGALPLADTPATLRRSGELLEDTLEVRAIFRRVVWPDFPVVNVHVSEEPVAEHRIHRRKHVQLALVCAAAI